ncbi:MAG TPA: MFS transporter [Mycobacteriales bacterium]|nr:MFS transporter [Mycobacteriales bacterium]
MTTSTNPDTRPTNRVTALRFVVGFGVVSALGDVVYEGARSVIGPFLRDRGATAAVVGLVTGIGEAVALVFRLGTGHLADRTGRPWPQTILGYGLTMVCVPLMALPGGLALAASLYNGERFGKALRSPARDMMLAHASAKLGTGYTFGLHEALDQTGALAGPLAIAAFLGLGGSLRMSFALLAVPGAIAMFVLVRLRLAAPDPAAYDPTAAVSEAKRLRLGGGLSRSFWLYAAFSAATMFGFATWGLLAFHLVAKHVVSAGFVPVLYAAAMGAAALTAVASGRVYDRVGFRGLIALPLLGVLVPLLSFRTSVAAVVAGAIVWGAGMGIHDSTMRAAVTDLVPRHRRGSGYGTFTAVYGLAWLAGAALIGLLYDQGAAAATWFMVAVQAVAAVLLLPLLTHRPHLTSGK